MKDTLKAGDKAEFAYQVPASKTVPHLYPEAHEFAMMPKVFATGFMVGLMEWTCMKVLEPHLDTGEGKHERFVIAWEKFEAIVNKKAKAARVSPLMRRKG